LEIQEHQPEEKIGLFKSNVLSVLLYGAESWKMTKTPSARSLKSEQVPAQVCSYILAPDNLKLCVAQKNRNITNHTASPAKETEMDWYCAAHAPAGGPLMAVEREADRNKHGEGQWRKR